jgi:hypothetical protein
MLMTTFSGTAPPASYFTEEYDSPAAIVLLGGIGLPA